MVYSYDDFYYVIRRPYNLINDYGGEYSRRFFSTCVVFGFCNQYMARFVRTIMSTKKTGTKHGFKTGESVVYPAHGVGKITAIEEQEIAGFKLELFVINFPKEKMTLRVPVAKVTSVGMRKLSEPDMVSRAMNILTGRARIKRTMWSRRAQEYEAKINSGDILAVSEVVRDLYRSDIQPEQSYSERQLYEQALARLIDELAVVDDITETEALKKIESFLSKTPRALKGSVEQVEIDTDDDDIEVNVQAA